MKRSGTVRTKEGAVAKIAKPQDLVQLFSKSPLRRQVERRFLIRFGKYLNCLNAVELHALVVSGEFNEMFPALEDEQAPAAARKFSDLKAFDYDDWARRTKVTG
jgi:hypothetical protein